MYRKVTSISWACGNLRKCAQLNSFHIGITTIRLLQQERFLRRFSIFTTTKELTWESLNALCLILQILVSKSQLLQCFLYPQKFQTFVREITQRHGWWTIHCFYEEFFADDFLKGWLNKIGAKPLLEKRIVSFIWLFCAKRRIPNYIEEGNSTLNLPTLSHVKTGREILEILLCRFFWELNPNVKYGAFTQQALRKNRCYLPWWFFWALQQNFWSNGMLLSFLFFSRSSSSSQWQQNLAKFKEDRDRWTTEIIHTKEKRETSLRCSNVKGGISTSQTMVLSISWTTPFYTRRLSEKKEDFENYQSRKSFRVGGNVILKYQRNFGKTLQTFHEFPRLLMLTEMTVVFLSMIKSRKDDL